MILVLVSFRIFVLSFIDSFEHLNVHGFVAMQFCNSSIVWPNINILKTRPDAVQNNFFFVQTNQMIQLVVSTKRIPIKFLQINSIRIQLWTINATACSPTLQLSMQQTIIFIPNGVCNLNQRPTYFGGFGLSRANCWTGNCTAVNRLNAKKCKNCLIFNSIALNVAPDTLLHLIE